MLRLPNAGAMSHTVRYGAHRICEACGQEFSSFDEHRRVVIKSNSDSFSEPEYHLCIECTSRVLEPLEGESPGMEDFA